MKSIRNVFAFFMLAVGLASCGGGGGGGESVDPNNFAGTWLLNLSLTRSETADPDCGGRVPPPPASVVIQQTGLEEGASVVAQLDNGVTLPGDVRTEGFMVTGMTLRSIPRCNVSNNLITTGEEVLVFTMNQADGEAAEAVYNFVNPCELDDQCTVTYRGTAVRQ